MNTSKTKVVTVQIPNGYSFLPGGGIEENESDKECLKREMLEETGYNIEIAAFLGSASRYFITSKKEAIFNKGYFYLVQLREKIQKATEQDHILKWIKTE